MIFRRHYTFFILIIVLSHLPEVNGRRKANRKNNRQRGKHVKADVEPSTAAPSMTPEVQGIICRHEVCNPATHYCDPFDSFCRKCEYLCVAGTYGMARRYGQPSRCGTLCPIYYEGVKDLTTLKKTKPSTDATRKPSLKAPDNAGRKMEAVQQDKEHEDEEKPTAFDSTTILSIVFGLIIVVLIAFIIILFVLLRRKRDDKRTTCCRTKRTNVESGATEPLTIGNDSPTNQPAGSNSDTGVVRSESPVQETQSESELYENEGHTNLSSRQNSAFSQASDSGEYQQ